MMRQKKDVIMIEEASKIIPREIIPRDCFDKDSLYDELKRIAKEYKGDPEGAEYKGMDAILRHINDDRISRLYRKMINYHNK